MWGPGCEKVRKPWVLWLKALEFERAFNRATDALKVRLV